MATTDQRLERIVEALGQLQVSLESLRGSLGTIVQTSADHEERLRSIERFQNMLTPTLAAITFVLGVVTKEAVGRWI